MSKTAPTEFGIKFNCDWTKSVPLSPEDIEPINSARSRLFQRRLIGKTADELSYGNLSVRIKDSPRFIITGTSTGHISELGPGQYSVVEAVDVAANYVRCSGSVRASSESLTHGAIYAARRDTNAVVHVHHEELWIRHLDTLPTTRSELAYGTPEIAAAVADLAVRVKEHSAVIVMGGHRGGLVSFGKTLDQALDLLLELQL